MPDKRKHRVFKTERRDIAFPLWRKKVDASIFYDKAILIAKSFEGFWKIPSRFKDIISVSDPNSKVTIHFAGKNFQGHIVNFQAKGRPDSYRIFYGSDLGDLLKDAFIMTFMRDLEFKLGEYATDEKRENIEDVIPFWEFLDIEYDHTKNELRFDAHYTQRPHFSHLFKKIVDSTVLRTIEIELGGKHEKRIVNSKWYRKAELGGHLDAKNVIYYLLDEPNKQIYVGEATSLKARLSGNRPEIPNWTHFRYDVLPPLLEPFRLEIERMLISSFMQLCACDAFKGNPKIISDHILMNKRP